MNRSLVVLLLAVLLPALLCGSAANAGGTADGSEEWGYVEVRPGAHEFWWLYRSPHRGKGGNGSAPWPTVLWLQGGPGASGVGYGNFAEIGPLDSQLNPRNSTWLHKADLLFVDHPVGTGYSFVEDQKLFVKTDEEAATDLTFLLKMLYNRNPQLQQSPLFLVAESYGGRYAATTALSIIKAVKAGELKLKLGGIALGDSWISPVDYVLSWGPLLYYVSRLDEDGLQQSNSIAEKIKEQVKEGKFLEAEENWEALEENILSTTNYVDFYNFLDEDLPSDSMLAKRSSGAIRNAYSRYLASLASFSGSLDDLMDTVIKKKLRVIPKNVSWGGQSGGVFEALRSDFMKPRIAAVDELLSLGINVTIYNGQLDLICATKGTENWVRKLKWDGLKNFTSTERAPLYCSTDEVKTTRAFYKAYRNLKFYWILEAGHMVPIEQPCIALKMIGEITQSPA